MPPPSDLRPGQRYNDARRAEAARTIGAKWLQVNHREKARTSSGWPERSRAPSSTASRSSRRGVYVNFLSDEPAASVRAAYGDDEHGRLVLLKRRYDPDNLLRRNHNIPPS
jgi:hypothetical protein